MIVNIKNILIGLLVVSFFGLLYAFLSSQPEMVADTSLRVEEEPLHTPHFSAQAEVEVEGEKSVELGAVLDEVAAVKIDAPVLNEIIAEDKSLTVEQLAVVNPNPFLDTADTEVDAVTVTQVDPVAPIETMVEEQDTKEVTAEVVEDGFEESDIAITGDIERQSDDDVSFHSTTDVAVIENSGEFLDLNLVETKPIEMVLIEGDDLILDDVNEGLGKFQSLISQTATGPPAISVTEEVSSVELEKPPTVISAIEIPEVDEALMNGTDEISLEYQAVMAKLIKVKEQMVEADAENVRLKKKFSSVVDENRELAILIKDIDIKIKTLTTTSN